MNLEDFTMPIDNYPDDGNHLECVLDLPFEIRKGENGYIWLDKNGVEHKYNMYKTDYWIENRWIVHLRKDANDSLNEIFEVRMNKDLNKIVRYCVKLYLKSLEMEKERVQREFQSLIKFGL